MGLRLAEGMDVGALASRLGLAQGDLIEADKLALFIRQGLMWQEAPRIGATEAGMLVLNSLIAQVTPDGLAG